MIGNNQEGAAGGGRFEFGKIPEHLVVWGGNGSQTRTEKDVMLAMGRLQINLQNYLDDIKNGIQSVSTGEFVAFQMTLYTLEILRMLKQDDSTIDLMYRIPGSNTPEEMYLLGKRYGYAEAAGQVNDKIAEILKVFKK